MTEQIRTQMTAAQFRHLPETNRFTELVHGEVIVSPSPVDKHQKLVVKLVLLLGRIIPGGTIIVAPMDVYLDEVNVFQPDVFWVAEDSRCVVRDGYYYGAPELVVEVHSPATITRDKREKFEAYERHGVREYWMVDPVGDHVEVWRREGERLGRQGVYSAGATFASRALGCDVTLEGVFAAV